MRKSWNPFGEGEDGMLKSAWVTTGDDRARSRECHKEKQGSRECCSKGVHSDDGALETKNEQKRRESQ
jgi:hypothetical protein